MNVLNIGGGAKGIELPAHYDGFEKIWLDIDERLEPDICLDVRELITLDAKQFDAVFGSHILEHIYPHELQNVLDGCYRIIKDERWCEFHVPDCKAAIMMAAQNQGNLGTPLYTSPAGIVTVRDMLWGYASFVADFGAAQAHKDGFTSESLYAALRKAGFNYIFMGAGSYEIAAVAFKQNPSDEVKARLGFA